MRSAQQKRLTALQRKARGASEESTSGELPVRAYLRAHGIPAQQIFEATGADAEPCQATARSKMNLSH